MKDNYELWLGFIKRDIPKWEEYDIPENPESWYETYCELREQVQREVDKDAEKLKMAMEGINSERAKHSAKFVGDQRTLRLPQQRPSARQRYASYDRKVGGITPVFAAPSSATLASNPLGAPAWTFERPQIPRSGMPDSRKKNSIFAPKRNKALAVPTKQLNNRATQVKAAPRSLIEEHRQPPGVRVTKNTTPPTLKVPGRAKPQSDLGSNNPVITPSLQEREARLRALTSGKSTNTSKPPETASASSPAPTASPSASTSKDVPTSLPTKKIPEPFTTKIPPRIIRQVPVQRNKSPSAPPQKSSGPSPVAPNPQESPQEPKPKALKRATPEPNSEGDEAKSPPAPAQAPRIATIRKRPAPNVFIQPKRRKLT